MSFTKKIKKQTEEMIVSLSEEFYRKNGDVTCEFSIYKDDISLMEDFVKDNVDLQLGKWVITQCETCKEYHGQGYVHASIERFDNLSKFDYWYDNVYNNK